MTGPPSRDGGPCSLGAVSWPGHDPKTREASSVANCGVREAGVYSHGAVTLAWATFRCLWASAAWHATGRKSTALCRNEHLSDSGSNGVLRRWPS